jgi:hypothetical protein
MRLLAAARSSPIVRAVLERPVLRFLGLISFSAYLFHYPIISFVAGLAIPTGLKFPLFTLLTLGFSTLTYWCIEKPLARIRLPEHRRSGRDRDSVDDLPHVCAEADDTPIREGSAVKAEDRRGRGADENPVIVHGQPPPEQRPGRSFGCHAGRLAAQPPPPGPGPRLAPPRATSRANGVAARSMSGRT